MKYSTLEHLKASQRISRHGQLVLVLFLAMVAMPAAAQVDPNDWSFNAGIPGDWETVGTCGSIGADGVVGLAPNGGDQYGYCVTTEDGPNLPGANGSVSWFPIGLFNSVSGNTSTGSMATSPSFLASPGDTLRFRVNYVTTDWGTATGADVAWVSLWGFFDDFFMDVLRASVRATDNGDVMPRIDMPQFLDLDSVSIDPDPVEMTIGPPGPEWSPLVNDSGACRGFAEQACGLTGWVEIEYVFPSDIAQQTPFRLGFGVVNMDDSIAQSGIAFDSIEFVPAAPATFTVEAVFDDQRGRVDPESQEVEPGATTTFEVTAETGFTRSDEVGGTCLDTENTGSWNGNVYTTPTITSDCTVEFNFESVPQITVFAEISGVGGSVFPPQRVVAEGQRATFMLEPDAGFFRSLDVTDTCSDEGEWIAINEYRTGQVAETCNVQFRFDPISDLLHLEIVNLGNVFGDGQGFVVFDVTNLASENLGPIMLGASLESGYEFTGTNSLLPSCMVEETDEGLGFICDVDNISDWICASDGGILECLLENLSQGGTASLVGIVSGQDLNTEVHLQAGVSLLLEEPPFSSEPFQDCADCPIMVPIPGGSFTQGSPESDPLSTSSEHPQHQVQVPAFAMGQTPVTFAQWDACVAEGGCAHLPDDNGWGRGDRPVVLVSWDDAQEYVDWLSDSTGHDYRLPSESEWEYATRAGTTGRFNTGECITTDQANFDGGFPIQGCPIGIFREQTLPVASFAPNAFGLYDTHGNVYEWVQDCWNENYVGAPSDGSAWMTGDCSSAVGRGGSWFSEGHLLTSATRSAEMRSVRFTDTGFRVARSTEQ